MSQKIVLTVVVPAESGCNLKCAGCIIAQRGEARDTLLSHEDYLRFVSETLSLPEVISFSIQGYEPLLEDAWPLSQQLLRLASATIAFDGEGKRTQCVTNGVNLAKFADELVHITDNIAVSIDSHDAAIHDLSRGKVGAWQHTVDGVRAVRKLFGASLEIFQEYLSIVSILYPGKVHRLERMPELLASLGVKRWTISPLIALRKDGYHGDAERIRADLLHLTSLARAHGVEVQLGDDLRDLESVGDLYQVLSVAAIVGDHVVVRLSPDGTLSVGKEILQSSHNIPKWNREESPREFLHRSILRASS